MIGAVLDVEGFARLFGEDPHRLVAVAPPETVELDPSLARTVGVMGAGAIALGASAVSLDEATKRICALSWVGPSILGHGDVAMPGVRRSALAAKLVVLVNP